MKKLWPIVFSISKDKLKTVAKNAAFEQLMLTLNTHKKVKDIKYNALDFQPYLKTEIIST